MTFTNILVAIDETPQSDAALALAVKLAAEQRATLTIATVIGRPGEVYAPPDVVVDPSIDARIEADAAALLERGAQTARGAGVEVTTCLHEGPVVAAIVGCIAEHRPDLVVVGTHGRRGIARALEGSIAEGVLRATTVPVLVSHAET